MVLPLDLSEQVRGSNIIPNTLEFKQLKLPCRLSEVLSLWEVSGGGGGRVGHLFENLPFKDWIPKVSKLLLT